MATATYICIQVPVPVWCMNGWRGLAMSQKDEGRVASASKEMDWLASSIRFQTAAATAPCPMILPCRRRRGVRNHIRITAQWSQSQDSQCAPNRRSPLASSIKGRVLLRPALSWLRNAPKEASAKSWQSNKNARYTKPNFKRNIYTQLQIIGNDTKSRR